MSLESKRTYLEKGPPILSENPIYNYALTFWRNDKHGFSRSTLCYSVSTRHRRATELTRRFLIGSIPSIQLCQILILSDQQRTIVNRAGASFVGRSSDWAMRRLDTATSLSDMEDEDDLDEEPGEVIESAPPLKVGEERELGGTGLKKKLIKRGQGWETPEFGDEATGTLTMIGFYMFDYFWCMVFILIVSEMIVEIEF